jgi:S-disulfanyl-L-cysteine oxidoreductase SoxD
MGHGPSDGRALMLPSGRALASTLVALASTTAIVGALTASVGHARELSRAQDSKAKKSASDGIYSDAQGKRGKTAYDRSCAACHGADLSGDQSVPPLAGDAFMAHWIGQDVIDLFGRIQTSMPQDRPGSLSPEACVDIIAYLLQENDFPSGADELKPDPALLKALIITRK